MAIKSGRRLITSTFDKYLLSLARGIARAQEELSGVRIQRPGEQPLSYHIPEVSFELKLGFEVDYEGHENDPGWIPQLKTHALNPASASLNNFTAEAASVIQGRFVSVPANGGTPLPVLEVALGKIRGQKKKLRVVATLRNTLGEPIEGAEVEFNVDRDSSTALNLESSMKEKDAVIPAKTDFENALAVTDESGNAEAVLNREGKKGQNIVLLIYAEDLAESLIVSNP